MSDYGHIMWDGERARLKTYSAATKPRVGSIIRIELEVTDPWTLGRLLEDLGEIYGKLEKAARDAAKGKPAPEPKALPAPPLQITFRGDE